MSPVVLVHGFTSSFERGWERTGVVDVLGDEGHDVIGVDLLGHGSAPKPHDPLDYADLGARVREVLPEVPIVGVGFSLGAQVLLEVACEEPRRFSRLVLAGAGASVFRDDDPTPLAAALETGSASADHPVAQAFVRFASTPGNDPLALAACLRRPQRTLTAERLAAITIPVVVILGDRDWAGPADPLVEALPDATYVGLRGVDHLGTPTHPAFFAALVRALA